MVSLTHAKKRRSARARCPYAHIVLSIKDVPHNDSGFIDSRWIDANLSAEMPLIHDSLSTDNEKAYARKT